MNEFWLTIRPLHNAIKMRASWRGRRLFLYLLTVVFGIFRTYTRARDLATYQTVFSNDSSCRNLIKVIRLIPRNNILTRSFSLGLLFFFSDAPRLFVIDKLTVNIIYTIRRELTLYIPRDPRNTPLPSPIYILLLL